MSLGAILLFLIVLGGLIAYAGDVIGRRVGRRHLRLFGLRPRTTGLVVAVFSGMLVALIVFAALMLFVRGARETLLEAERVRAERDQLLAERERLSEQVENLKGQAARAFAESERLRTRVGELAGRLEAAEDRLRGLEHERALLEARLRELTQEAEVAQTELARLRETEAQLKAEIERLRAARAEAERRAEEAQTRLARLGAERARLEEEVRALELRYRTLQGDLAELNALKGELERQNESLRLANEALSRELSESRLEAARLKGRVEELAKRSDRLLSGLEQTLEGEVLAEVFLSRGEDPRRELERALRQAESRAKLLGLPPLSPLLPDPSGWEGPGLILVEVEGIAPDGRLRVGARFVPTRVLFEPGEVVAEAPLPEEPSRVLEALVRLRREAEARLLELGVPPHRVAEGRIPDRELVRFAERYRGKRARAAVVAEELLTTTGPVRLKLVLRDER